MVAFDAAIRRGNARTNASDNRLLGQAFLHRSRVPLELAPINHVTRAERAAEVDELEHGVANGCSPWACRSGEIEPEQDDFGLAC
ncbi:hypothetical protein OG304_06835 [Streptomyces sp. NBC_00160]|uniref:hypothetical protein n=1 Tax=Streptomyces sp. NBC_00160 TaxID=2903628 RepID=UPI002251A14F|nr:hypothetical protein [Streptomyces sp. NBC_00160]MCX5303168.1 hypothetical protein [Streptomyces sp. NBC_00160]